MIVNTPSGYEVTLKDYLTFGQERELQKIAFKDVKMSSEELKKQDFKLPIVATFEMQELQIKFLVVKILYPEGNRIVTENLFDEIMNWKKEDGEAVLKAISEMTNPPAKKK